ncbi:outer membrane lipid asymmetry maintenance protein MlaD [Amylibacter kogurei]|uniref:Outer membrane lipid asymmetry maintenance protein MlaD n=1 Tax=Paramylibacter kogurei TaxID=1889778 RepID=A0A2G5K713_9RHOB|nr:outer membrane lipid asymmetry maintenance protein MlaD [Amylibacter kogurei]PIB24802.1 outer membrane lipid asymmetry maintenance protein MlaD [Amylibacter kogurei]
MAHNLTETAVGAVVVAAAAGFLIFASSSVGFSTKSGGYELNASFRSADGVAVGTDVRMAGVKVGTVTALALDPESFRANMQFSMRDDLKIPEDSGVQISQEGLLGGTFVEVVPGGSEFAMEQGGEFIDTQGSVSLISLLLKFVAGSEQ